MATAKRKKILFIFRQAPHGTTQAQEALDILLMASSFNHEISLLFLSDGIFNLIKQQATNVLGNKNFTSAYQALPLYDINNIHIAKRDLIERNLKNEDLFLTPTLLTDAEIQMLIQKHDAIFNF